MQYTSGKNAGIAKVYKPLFIQFNLYIAVHLNFKTAKAIPQQAAGGFLRNLNVDLLLVYLHNCSYHRISCTGSPELNAAVCPCAI